MSQSPKVTLTVDVANGCSLDDLANFTDKAIEFGADRYYELELDGDYLSLTFEL